MTSFVVINYGYIGVLLGLLDNTYFESVSLRWETGSHKVSMRNVNS